MDRRELIIGAAGLSAVLYGCSQDGESDTETGSSLAEIERSGRLRAGFIAFPPVIIRDPNTRSMSGHFVATAREIAQQSEWDIEFVETDWANFRAGLEARRFDVSIAPTFVTIPRAKAVVFSDPLFFAGNSAIVRVGESRFTDIGSFDQPDVTIVVTQGEAGQEFASTHFRRARIRALPGPDQALTLQEVLSGRADAALGDAYVVSQFAAQHRGRVVDHFAADPYNLTPVSWAVARGNGELLSFLNAAIQALDTQGKLLEFERAAGAQWLHPERNYVLPPASSS